MPSILKMFLREKSNLGEIGMMKMDNVNIYEIIGTSFDSIYMALHQLSNNAEIVIDKYTIRKTDKFYEIENGDLHECFSEKEKCYQFLNNLIMTN